MASCSWTYSIGRDCFASSDCVDAAVAAVDVDAVGVGVVDADAGGGDADDGCVVAVAGWVVVDGDADAGAVDSSDVAAAAVECADDAVGAAVDCCRSVAPVAVEADAADVVGVAVVRWWSCSTRSDSTGWALEDPGECSWCRRPCSKWRTGWSGSSVARPLGCRLSRSSGSIAAAFAAVAG